METLAVIALMANILDFVNLGVKLVSKSREIRKSINGAIGENKTLELVTDDLLVLRAQIELSARSSSTALDSNDSLHRLLEEARAVGDKLLLRLNKVKSTGPNGAWKSVRKALKCVCSKEEIQALAVRLSNVRDQIQTHILVQLPELIVQSSSENSKATMAALDSLRTTLIAKHDPQDQKLDGFTSDISKSTLSEGPVCDEMKPVSVLLRDSKRRYVQEAILRSLSYPTMYARREKIPQAHAETLKWILEGPEVPQEHAWDNFIAWLQCNDPLYWINGKAASGKSTLMKFLLDQEVVREALNKWGAGHQLTLGDFFFWSLGNEEQKSQEGLLMSLLHQVLEERNDIIEDVAGTIWSIAARKSSDELQALHDSWYPWTLPELQRTLETFLSNVGPTTKICLFVDGLDEFSGDHGTIAHFFKHLSSFPSVKLCVSSRPLLPFEYAFKDCKGLQLQELTREGIQKYVRDKLDEHRHFALLCKHDTVAGEDLIKEIVQTSSGVFLWIYLVVRSLLDGLTNQDSLEDLRMRLRELPPELDALYAQILRSVQPPFYKEQASQLLQIFHQWNRPVSSLALSFADHPDPNLAIDADLEPLSEMETDEQIQGMTNRLKSRCRGLLEINNHPVSGFDFQMYSPKRGDEVQYLHLTVKEYLEQPATWTELCQWTKGKEFDANVACLRGQIMTLKKMAAYNDDWSSVSSFIKEILRTARNAETSSGQAQIRLVDEMDRIGPLLLRGEDERHWSSHLLASNDQDCPEDCDCKPRTFAHLAIANGLTLYVKERYGQSIESINQQWDDPLLTVTTWGSSSFEDTLIHTPMVQYLLDKDLEPNEERNGTSPWVDLLKSILFWKSMAPKRVGEWLAAARLFVLYGADLQLPINDRNNQFGSAADALRWAFGHLPVAVTSTLFEMTEGPTRSGRGLNGTAWSNEPLEARISRPGKGRKRKQFTPRGRGGKRVRM